MRAFPLIALSTLAATLTANAAAISLVNHGFETGDLTGWVSTGNVQALGPTSVVTFNNIVWDITPNGDVMGALNSDGAIATELDAFFGLPFGTLQNLNLPGVNPAGGALTNGSGIYQDFMGNAGDTVTMFFDYVARDYVSFNDPAFGVLVGPTGFQAQILASIWGGGIEVDTAGNSGWRAITFTLAETGMHRLGFAVTNDKDTILVAALFLDVAPGGSSTDDPGDLVPGESPLFPVLPDSGGFGGPFEFFDPTPGLWYDPPFAEAYTYTLFGGAEFIEFSTPDAGFGFGDLLFTDLTGANASFVAMAGVKYAIAPTSSFKISGIPNFAIDFQDPNFAIAFPAFLDWTGTATKLQIDITPHPDAIPEPSTYALLGAGLAVLAYRRFRA
jgi:hypothetical protein